MYRYANRYSAGGFKRMMTEGFSYENTMLPYVPTYTAVGHSCIYTGSVPALNGMIGNNWYDESKRANVYCTEDTSVQGVGGAGLPGQMSPDNLWTTTITDELRLASNFKSKVVGVALKDRGSILPAGHAANAAYWYDDRSGKFITSTYYMNTLPQWVAAFNAADKVRTYMSKPWNTLYDVKTYTQSTADEKIYEGKPGGLNRNTFPYDYSKQGAEKYSSFKFTPYAASFTFDFAKNAIVNENMGAGAATDFLAVSISSTDYAGHSYGPNSVELEDTYLRLDRDISDFLTYLDAKLGKGNYLVFLSADHGAAHVPGFLQENKIPAGTFSEASLLAGLNKMLLDSFSISNGVTTIINYQVYINKPALQAAGVQQSKVTEAIISILQKQSFITHAFATAEIYKSGLPQPVMERVINGYNPKRSGEVGFIIKPAYFDGGVTGTTHGLWNPYDAHIPLLFFGWKVKPGHTYRETYMTDIAPTLAAKLNIQMPNGTVGHVLEEVQ